MRKRQKLILIIYLYLVMILGFIYVPYIKNFPNGVKKYVGHHLRIKLMSFTPWENTQWGYTTIDANLIIAEILAVTAIFAVAFLLLKRES